MKVLACVIFASLVLYLPAAFAHEDVEKSYDEVIQEILAAQNAASLQQIGCSDVSEEQFEQLGDAIMEKMAGSDELHEQMDRMMGGEGSQSLHSMHVAMGENWLGCGVNDAPMGGMMGNRMMPMMMGMMGSYYPAYFSGYDTALFAAATGWIFFTALLIFILFRKGASRRKK